MNAADIANAILRTPLNSDEINIIADALRRSRDMSRMRAAGSFQVGEKVTFTARNGVRYYGVVTKVNTKNIKVTTNDGRFWNVSATLLQHQV